jgi:hypothetical protein
VPLSLPTALRRYAASDPEAPWLFRSAGWDWVWHSWAELSGWQLAWTARLTALPPGSRAAFRDQGSPESVILDLAIQAAGLTSVPLPEQEAAGGDAAWIDIENGDLAIRSAALRSGVLSRQSADAGGAVVRIDGREVEWTAADLAGEGERVGELVGPAKVREVVVLGSPLADPVARAMLAWATLAGAAVVLEPDPALRAATAAWARPTVFHGTAAEIAHLRARVTARGRRRPFRRLRVLLVAGALEKEDAAFWQARGVRVERMS